MPFPDICLNDKQHRPNEWPTLRFKQKTKGSQDVYLRVSNGQPLLLEDDKHIIILTVVERNPGNILIRSEGEIITADDGHVRFEINECELLARGLFIAEISVYDTTLNPCGELSDNSSSSDDDSSPVRVEKYRAYVEVEADVTDMTTNIIGVSIAEIRLAIRDLSREDNFLLDDVEYTDTEIAWAMRRPVDNWNETPPDMKRYRYTPATFPYRYEWINAVKGELMLIAAAAYRRNHLAYSAAGLTVDDKNKGQIYEQLGQLLIDKWKEWVIIEKKSLNFRQCFNTTNIASFGRTSRGR
jgi:hypothetical protein